MQLDIASFSLGFGNENEDYLAHVAVEGAQLLAIADGVGASERSGEASRIAVEASLEALSKEGVEGMAAAFEKARQELILRTQESGAKSMSTTLTVCWIARKTAVFGHVGDARIYHLRGAGLQTRTTDQTEVEHLVAQGVLTRQRARKYSRKNVLLSAVSSSSQFELQIGQFGIEEGDRILMLTDGLYKRISKQEILEISLRCPSVSEFVDGLKQLVVGKEMIDDASALCAEVKAL